MKRITVRTKTVKTLDTTSTLYLVQIGPQLYQSMSFKAMMRITVLMKKVKTLDTTSTWYLVKIGQQMYQPIMYKATMRITVLMKSVKILDSTLTRHSVPMIGLILLKATELKKLSLSFGLVKSLAVQNNLASYGLTKKMMKINHQ